jgi:hypothetical protein
VKYLVQAEEEEFKIHPEYLHSEFTNVNFCAVISHHFQEEERKIREKLEKQSERY